jgi:hypothetical protein
MFLIVFFLVSSFLSDLLKSMSDAGDDGFTLIAPDFAVEDFTQLIHLLHTGIEAFSWVTVEILFNSSVPDS